MDQGNLAIDGIAAASSPTPGFAPTQLTGARLTPLRVVLMTLGAVLGGVVLSLVLSSSPAQAADGDDAGPGAGPGLLTGAAAAVDTTLDQTVGALSPMMTELLAPAATAPASETPAASPSASMPARGASIDPLRRAMTVLDRTVSTVLPGVTPVTEPVFGMLNGALSRVDRLISPAVAALPAAVTALAEPTDPALALPTSTALDPATSSGSADGTLAPRQSTPDADGSLPGSVVSSSTALSLAALGAVLLVLALAAVVLRRRSDDDVLPASPVFETDTSPA